MVTRTRQHTDAEMRLITLFREIENEDLQDIIASVVAIERQHRTGSRKNFPIRDVRNVIDKVARLQEIQTSRSQR